MDGRPSAGVPDVLLLRYLADDLPAEVRCRIDAQIEASSQVKDRLEQLAQEQEAFLAARPPAAFAHQVAVRLSVETPQPKPARFSWWLGAPSLAAAAGLVLAVGYSQWTEDKMPSLASPREALPAAARAEKSPAPTPAQPAAQAAPTSPAPRASAPTGAGRVDTPRPRALAKPDPQSARGLQGGDWQRRPARQKPAATKRARKSSPKRKARLDDLDGAYDERVAATSRKEGENKAAEVPGRLGGGARGSHEGAAEASAPPPPAPSMGRALPRKPEAVSETAKDDARPVPASDAAAEVAEADAEALTEAETVPTKKALVRARLAEPAGIALRLKAITADGVGHWLADGDEVSPGAAIQPWVSAGRSGFMLIFGLREDGRRIVYHGRGNRSVRFSPKDKAKAGSAMPAEAPKRPSRERIYVLLTDRPVEVDKVLAASGLRPGTLPQRLSIDGLQAAVTIRIVP